MDINEFITTVRDGASGWISWSFDFDVNTDISSIIGEEFDDCSEEITEYKASRARMRETVDTVTLYSEIRPLHYAVLYGCADAVTELIKAGADTTKTCHRKTNKHSLTERYDGREKRWKISGDTGRKIVSTQSGDYTPLELAEEQGIAAIIAALTPPPPAATALATAEAHASSAATDSAAPAPGDT